MGPFCPFLRHSNHDVCRLFSGPSKTSGRILGKEPGERVKHILSVRICLGFDPKLVFGQGILAESGEKRENHERNAEDKSKMQQRM